MAITTCTSHFINFDAACRYYAGYGYTHTQVQQKLNSGEIHLGPPVLKEGESSQVDKIEGRYIIQAKEKSPTLYNCSICTGFYVYCVFNHTRGICEYCEEGLNQ